MRPQSRVTMMRKNLLKSVVFIASLLLIQGCMDKLNLTSYQITYPEKNATYIGTVNNAPPAGASGTEQLAGEFVINYATPPSSRPDIVLNGHSVSQYFTFGPSEARGDIEQFKQFFRHGKNTLSVAPTSFGPTMIFNLDTKGPAIIITRGEVVNGGADLELEGYLRDFSAADSVLELDLVQISGYQVDGTVNRSIGAQVQVTVDSEGRFCAVDPGNTEALTNGKCANGAPQMPPVDLNGLLMDPENPAYKPLLYSFTARDVYGYQTKKEFLADTNASVPPPLQNAVRVALNDTFIASMRPVIANAIYESLRLAPIDARCLASSNKTNWATSGSTCSDWDDDRICGNKRGVLANRNISPDEFQALDMKDGVDDDFAVVDINNDGTAETGVHLSNAYFNCDNSSDPRFYKDLGYNTDGGKLPSGLNPIDITISGLGTMQAWVQQFYMHDGTDRTVAGENLNNKVGTILLNRFEVLGSDLLSVDLQIREMIVRLEIPGNTLSVDIGELYLERVDIAATNRGGNVLIQKNRGPGENLLVQLESDNLDISMSALKMQGAEVCLWIICIPLDGIVNFIGPAIQGLVEDLLPTIINPILQENLQKLVIGGMVAQPDNATSFDMLMNIEELGTETIIGENEMVVALDSIVDVLQPDPYAKSMLGPVFFDDPINPSDVVNVNAGSNLSVGVNSNLINQSLAAMHATGVTFFTLYNGKTYYGAHPNVPAADPLVMNSPTIASKGDTRTRLWPDMPPSLVFSEVVGSTGTGRAAIEFESATLYQDKLVQNSAGDLIWKNEITLKVNFDLAVEIDEQDGVFTMGAAGPPVFTINEMINNTPFQVPPAIIQGVLDAALLFGGDLLADQFIVLDLNKIVSGQLNGRTVKFLSANDDWTMSGDGSECIVYDADIDGYTAHPDAVSVSNAEDGKYDTICFTLAFNVSTQTAGVTGPKGSNLFFQMTVQDPNFPPPPALPRFDLDQDGVLDYRDNCSVPQSVLEPLIESYPGGLPAMVDQDGNPSNAAVTYLRNGINSYYSHPEQYGAVDQDDIDWFNQKRGGNSSPTNEWTDLLFYNPNQSNTDSVTGDNDRIGDLCEDDPDRDGVWSSYNVDSTKNDNCPGVYNPLQEDSSAPAGVGDACNVREAYVLIRSLGSKYQNQSNQSLATGPFLCFTHEGFKSIETTQSGVDVGPNMNYSNGPVLKECNPYDPNQRWYIKENNAPAPAGMDSANERMYQIFADADRSNSTSWQLVSWSNGGTNSHLKMAKMNSSTKYEQTWSGNVVDTRWVFGVDPAAKASSVDEDNRHPWILRPGRQAVYDVGSCLFFNNDGWGPDTNPNQCASSYTLSPGSPSPLVDKFYRWGIFIKGEQLWNGQY